MKNTTCIVKGVSWAHKGGEIYEVHGEIGTKSNGLHITGDFSDEVLGAFKQAIVHAKDYFKELPLEDMSVHIHFPKAIDGPSCGLPIFMCLYSLLSDKPIIDGLVFTGELSKKQTLYPIGGLSQKVLTARLNGFKGIVFPNQTDPIEDASGIMLCPVTLLHEAVLLGVGA